MSDVPDLLRDRGRETVERAINEYVASIKRYVGNLDEREVWDAAVTDSITLLLELIATDRPDVTLDDRIGVALVIVWSFLLEEVVEFVPNDESGLE